MAGDPGEECVAFLQWALPRLGLRWAGYRKVRRQVCRRVRARVAALGLGDLDAYRGRLAAHGTAAERDYGARQASRLRAWRDSERALAEHLARFAA